MRSNVDKISVFVFEYQALIQEIPFSNIANSPWWSVSLVSSSLVSSNAWFCLIRSLRPQTKTFLVAYSLACGINQNKIKQNRFTKMLKDNLLGMNSVNWVACSGLIGQSSHYLNPKMEMSFSSNFVNLLLWFWTIQEFVFPLDAHVCTDASSWSRKQWLCQMGERFER